MQRLRVVQWSSGGVGELALAPDCVCSPFDPAHVARLEEACVATALRVNAIPYVCDAPPGLATPAELPPTLPRHAFEGARGSWRNDASALDPRSEPQASEGEAA